MSNARFVTAPGSVNPETTSRQAMYCPSEGAKGRRHGRPSPGLLGDCIHCICNRGKSDSKDAPGWTKAPKDRRSAWHAKGQAARPRKSQKEANIPHRNQPKAAAPSFWLLQSRQRPCFLCCDGLHPWAYRVGSKKDGRRTLQTALYRRGCCTDSFSLPTRQENHPSPPCGGRASTRTYFPGPVIHRPSNLGTGPGKGDERQENR